MDRRAELGKIFREILGTGNVYFQPPSNTQMRYPAIRYERSEMAVKHADNGPYNRRIRYMVTVIDSNPDSEIVNRVSMLPYCYFDRHYAQDNLNHDVFEIYF